MRPLRRLSSLIVVSAVACLASSCGVLADPPSSLERSAEPEETSKQEASKEEPSSPQFTPSNEAAEAGGICEYLDFEVINKATGQPFGVAESGGSEEVPSCVLQTTAGSFPDITFTRANTATDSKTYREEIPPKGAEKIEDFGKAGYSAVRDKVKGGGPVIEIGWLTDGHMYSFRYTTAADTSKDDAEAVVDDLIAVVKDVGEATEKDD